MGDYGKELDRKILASGEIFAGGVWCVGGREEGRDGGEEREDGGEEGAEGEEQKEEEKTLLLKVMSCNNEIFSPTKWMS